MSSDTDSIEPKNSSFTSSLKRFQIRGHEGFVSSAKALLEPWISLSKSLRDMRHDRLLKEDFGVDSVRSSALGDICLHLIEMSLDDDNIDCICNLSDAGGNAVDLYYH